MSRPSLPGAPAPRVDRLDILFPVVFRPPLAAFFSSFGRRGCLVHPARERLDDTAAHKIHIAADATAGLVSLAAHDTGRDTEQEYSAFPYRETTNKPTSGTV
jgi:hypothetical protein